MNGPPSVFGWLRLRLLRNAWRSARLRPARTVGAALLVAMLWAGLYGVFYAGFEALDHQYSDLYLVVLSVIFAAFFLIMFALLTFSNALVNYASLFRSWDVEFFRASPAAPARVFWHKAADSAGYSLWALALLGLPIVFAFGHSAGAGVKYYLVSAAAMAAFTLISVPVGAVLALLFVRFVLPSRRRVLLVGLAAALFFGFLSAGEWLRRRTDADDPLADISVWVEGPLARVTMARNPFLPSAWLSDCLIEAAFGEYGEAAYSLALLGANALFFGMVAWLAAERLYGPAFFVAHGGGRKKRSRGAAFYRFVEVVLPTFSAFKRLLLVKDLKVFLRSPVQWSQALIFCGILLVYFTNIRHVHAVGTGFLSKELCAFVNFVATAMTVCTLTVRFAFPMVSLEGLNFWVLGPLPVKRGDIVEAKFLGAALAALLCGATLTLVSDLSLGVDRRIMALHLAAVVVIALGLGTLSIGLGAVYPSFREGSPSKIASGFGGTVNLTLSLGFCAAVLAFMVLPFHLGGGDKLQPPFAQMWQYRAHLGIGVVVLTAVLFLAVSRMGIRALEELEM